jgi:hypothetical protein
MKTTAKPVLGQSKAIYGTTAHLRHFADCAAFRALRHAPIYMGLPWCRAVELTILQLF